MQKGIPVEGDAMDVETKEESLEWYSGSSMSHFPVGVERPCGLRNLGNTCYMNSIVQALAHTKPIAAFLVSDWVSVTSPGAGVAPSTDTAISRRRFNEGLAETVRIIWSGKQRDYICRSLMKAVFDTIPDFRVHGQQDAEEALTYTLNNLHDDLFVPVPKELHPAFKTILKLETERKQLDDAARARGVKKDDEDEAVRLKKEEEARICQAYEPYKRSIVSDTFQSLVAQRVRCSKCESTSLTVQECFTMPLELPSKTQTKAQNGSASNGADTRAASNSKSAAHLKSMPSTSSLDPNSPKGASSSDGPSSSPSLLSSAWQTLKSTFSFGYGLDLEQCMRSFFASETLKGEEQYYCENCKSKEDAVKTHELVHLPEILCLQLKRFNKNRGTFGLASAKNSTSVRFPVEGLDLAPFCSSEICEGSTTYDLISVVRHSGGANSGHYIATCKSPVQGKWFEFDDEFVSPVSSNEALQSSDAYLLFYARRASDDDQDRKDKAMKVLKAPGSSQNGRAYVSRYWALKFETLSQPGPIDNYAFTCEHGGVAMPVIKAELRDSRERVTQRVVPVTTSALNDLATLYGGPFPAPAVRSLDPCAICRDSFEALVSRRLAEGEEYTDLEGNSTGKIFFAIPVPWFQRWLAFVRNDVGPLGRGSWMGVLPPGEIDFHSFFEKDGRTLKSSLKPRTHYIMVNRPLLRFWEQAYGTKGQLQARYGTDLYGPPVAPADVEAEMEVDIQSPVGEEQ